MNDCLHERQTIPIISQFCFTCKISDASLQRLCSIMLPWSSLFQILQFPRCIQDLYIVSLLFQAVAADCFLFKHKSHLLTPNCCLCLFLQISIPLLHLLKSRIMHIQDLCTWHYSCEHVGSSFMKHILYSNEALKRFHLKNDQNLFVCLQT